MTADFRDLPGVLAATLKHAATGIPFYRQTFGETWRTVRHPDALSTLPLLTKDLAIAHQEELVASDATPFVGTVLSVRALFDADLGGLFEAFPVSHSRRA